MRLSIVGLMIFMMMIACDDAVSQEILKTDVISSYNGCLWRDNGNGTTTVSAIFSYKRALGRIGNRVIMLSRSVQILGFDKNGVPRSVATREVRLNGVIGNYNLYISPGMVYGDYRAHPLDGHWHEPRPFAAEFTVTVDNTAIAEWPALGLTAGNIGGPIRPPVFVFEQSGTAYLTPDSDGRSCEVINPHHPPKPRITLNMRAPDWNLGELSIGNGEKRFTAAADQLCFSYAGAMAGNTQVVLSAESQNGVVENKYQLKNLRDANQVVPYSIVLDGDGAPLLLPNTSQSTVKLNASGNMCFLPTFKTFVKPGLSSGNYTDVLTFVISTKT